MGKLAAIATNGCLDTWVLIFPRQRKELNLDFEIQDVGCVLLYRAQGGYQCGTKSHIDLCYRCFGKTQDIPLRVVNKCVISD